MSEPFIAEVKIFAGNFAPRGYAFCDGQLMPIAQNTALFSLVGTTYGGDGRTTFAVPNLAGRAAMHPGNGPGLTSRRLGQTGGTDTVTLSEAQMPSHSHAIKATNESADTGMPMTPAGADPATNNSIANTGPTNHYGPGDATTSLAGVAITNLGGSQAHNNLQPYLALNFIIALQGLFPSRN